MSTRIQVDRPTSVPTQTKQLVDTSGNDQKIIDISKGLSSHPAPARNSHLQTLASILEDGEDEQAQVKTAKSVNCCAFFPLLVPGMLEATAEIAHQNGETSEEEITAMLKNRNLFYGSIPFIVYGIATGSSFGVPILIGGAALAIKNLMGLHNRAKVYQARWIG